MHQLFKSQTFQRSVLFFSLRIFFHILVFLSHSSDVILQNAHRMMEIHPETNMSSMSKSLEEKCVKSDLTAKTNAT